MVIKCQSNECNVATKKWIKNRVTEQHQKNNGEKVFRNCRQPSTHEFWVRNGLKKKKTKKNISLCTQRRWHFMQNIFDCARRPHTPHDQFEKWLPRSKNSAQSRSVLGNCVVFVLLCARQTNRNQKLNMKTVMKWPANWPEVKTNEHKHEESTNFDQFYRSHFYYCYYSVIFHQFSESSKIFRVRNARKNQIVTWKLSLAAKKKNEREETISFIKVSWHFLLYFSSSAVETVRLIRRFVWTLHFHGAVCG